MVVTMLVHGEFTMKVLHYMRRVAGTACEFMAREVAFFANERTRKATKCVPRKAPWTLKGLQRQHSWQKETLR